MTSLTAQRADARRTSRPAPRGTDQPEPTRFPVRTAIVLACLAVTLFWWHGTPASVGATPGGALVAIAELTGLIASVLVCAQLLLVARVPWFERSVGMDRLVSWHKSLGTTVILPAAVRYQTELAQNVATLKAAGLDADTTLLEAVSTPIAELTAAVGALKAGLSDHSAESALEEATHAQKVLLPAMDAVRAAADALEGVVADDLWPLPTYQEMLYIL